MFTDIFEEDTFFFLDMNPRELGDIIGEITIDRVLTDGHTEIPDILFLKDGDVMTKELYFFVPMAFTEAREDDPEGRH